MCQPYTSPAMMRQARMLQLRTAWRLLPYALRHTTHKPFRSTPQARNATDQLQSAEFRRTAHDMYCEMFLDGYRQATSYRVSRDTGLALVLFMVFIFTFDQEFEHARRLGDPPGYQSVIDTPRVAEIWTALADYLRAFGRDEEILAHLRSTFAKHYDDYCGYVAEASGGAEFAVTLRLVERDSGMTLRTVYEIIRLFNGHRSHPGCARQFFDVGMAGKFLDDIRDMVDDVAAGDPNLLYSLAAENHRERDVLEAAMEKGEPIDLWWWANNCPCTLESFFAHTFRYYDQVLATKLRLSLDICHCLLYSRRYWRTPIRRSPIGAQ
ncbi:hypothetical protein [Rhodococcus koreensis]